MARVMLILALVACLTWQLPLATAASSKGNPLSRRSGTSARIPVATDEGHRPKSLKVPEPTFAGFLPVDDDLGSSMFHLYYEAQEFDGPMEETPILLWLQGGPGCSSLFGMLYINGPYFVNEDDLTLRRNLGSWNRKYGMLFIEQPLGTGFSNPGKQNVPDNELDVATDLYRSLQAFYRAHPRFSKRKLVVTGESYAGKYVPSISHYILQADLRSKGLEGDLHHARRLPNNTEAPVFMLGGFAIGNGWTDAETQMLTTAETAWNMGLIDLTQRRKLEQLQFQAVDLILSHQHRKARNVSDTINEMVRSMAGSALLEDVRRNLGYDGNDGTTKFLNQPHVKAAMKAPMDVTWEACSAVVDVKLRHDVMRTVKPLVMDLLRYHPALFYQGQYDAECGYASNDAWISTMKWDGHLGFAQATRRHWVVNDKVAGYWKIFRTLSFVLVRNTGHMVPHDNPLYGQILIEKWVDEQVLGKAYKRTIKPSMDAEFANPDQGIDACCQPDLGPDIMLPSAPAAAAMTVDSTADATGDYAAAGAPAVEEL